MCGKFTAMMTWREYCDLAGVSLSGDHPGPDAMDNAHVLGTMTPMAKVPVLHLGPVRQRRITPMRWGWPDIRSADPFKGFRHLHARSEEIDRTPTWIEPFHETRGVVFTKSFNIGETLPSGKTKQWVCSRADGAAVAIAVIYSSWELPQGTLRALAMITTASCEPLSTKDERMPALLEPDEVGTWLGETGATPTELKALLRPYESSLVIREQGSSTKKPEARNSKKADAPTFL
jgi:putative SOS response-associated peptidase YedK